MKRFWVIILLIALAILLFAGFRNGDPHCRKTEDLEVSGLIYHVEDEGLLSVTLDNKSKNYDYDDVIINALFYDPDNVYLGGFRFSVKHEVNAGETDNYLVWIDDAEPIARVEYEVVCAKYD